MTTAADPSCDRCTEGTTCPQCAMDALHEEHREAYISMGHADA